MADQPLSEVKGIWFAAAGDYLREAYDNAALASLVDAAPLRFREVYARPLASSWYPEQALEVALMLTYDHLARRDDAAFEKIIEGSTAKGIKRLFRLLLRSSSTSFLLRRVPSIWRTVHRGAGHVEVVQGEGASDIYCTEFPWFDNPLYRMMAVASMRALVTMCTGSAPSVSIVRAAPDALHMHVAYATQERAAPTVRFASTRPADDGSPSFPPPRPASK